MKNECEYTQDRLSRLHSGHLFKLQRLRIEAHLSECPVCRSRFDAINRIRETERFLHDLDGTAGIPGTLRQIASVGSRLLFRPLWLALIIIGVLSAYRYVVDPILHDPDLEQLDAGTPLPPAAAVQTAPTPTPVPEQPAAPVQRKEPAPAANPVQVTIAVEKDREKESIRQINDAMKEHAVLRTLRFSEKVREVAGSLTTDELYVFFNRIQGAAKVTYRRSRLSSAGQDELVPVVLKLQVIAAPVRRETGPPAGPVDSPVQKPVETPGEKPAGNLLKSVDEQGAVPTPPVR